MVTIVTIFFEGAQPTQPAESALLSYFGILERLHVLASFPGRK